MCNQSVGLIQRGLEERGLASVAISLAPEITRKSRPSRFLFVAHPFGLTFGDVHDDALQKEVLLRSLERGIQIDQTGGGLIDLGYRWDKDDLRERQLRKLAK